MAKTHTVFKKRLLAASIAAIFSHPMAGFAADIPITTEADLRNGILNTGVAGDRFVITNTITLTQNLVAPNSPSGILISTGQSGTLDLAGFNLEVGGASVSTGGNLLLGGGTLVIGGNNSTTGFSGTLSGTGTVTKNGTGTLGLGPQVTFSGTLNANGGHLNLSSAPTTLNFGLNVASGVTITPPGGQLTLGSLSGAASLGFGNNLTIGNDNTSTSYSGVLGGNGTLTKQGTGTQTLTGANTYVNGTTVTAGTLSGTTTSLQGAITNNATVTFDQTTNGTYAGVMSGTGALNKTGTGTVTLTGANTYTGATNITTGTLRAGAANVVGAGGGSAVTVAAGATLDLNSNNQAIGSLAGGGNVTLGTATLTAGAANTSTTFFGVISGTGGLSKAGTGVLTLSGANTYSGGTTVTAGTLTGTTTSLQGAIANNAMVSFDQASTGTYAGVMSGTGTLAKAGSGNLILTSANTYTGATTVNAGTLSVNGSIASPVTVASGGTLGGSGTINGVVSIVNGGVLAPGNSIGTLSVNGNVNFAAGSTLRVEIDAAGAADRINVTGAPGTATINGGTVDVQASAGTYQRNTRYTIVNATGGVTGTFANVTSNLAFLTPALAYDTNNVFLDMTRNSTSFNAIAQTRNQRAVATALDNSATGASAAFNTLLTAITGLSAPQARNAFDAASGVGLVELRRASAGFAGEFGQHLNRRLGLVASTESATRNAGLGSPLLLAASDRPSDLGAMFAQAPSSPSSSPSSSSPFAATKNDGRGFWLRATGANQDTDSDGNAAGSRLRGSGLTLGVDSEWGDGLVVGVAASGGSSRLAMDNSMGSGRSRGSALGAYASYTSGPWLFKGSLGFSWNDNHLDRAITAGVFNASASADFKSRSVSAYGEASYEMNMGSYRLRPIAALAHTQTSSDAFSERNAGVANLQVAGQNTTSTRSLLGVKTSHEVGSLMLEPRLLWAHEYGNLNAPLTMTISGAPAAAGSFQIYGVEQKRDSAILGLAASGSMAKNLTLVADVQLEAASRQNKLAAFVGVRASW
ncbi:MAG: autotransporter domain-containing protein [Burkholderiales bacterium]